MDIFNLKNKMMKQDDKYVKDIKDNIHYLSLLSLNKLLSKFSTSMRGMNKDKIIDAIHRYGRNIIETELVVTKLMIFWNSVKTPFNIVLFFLMIVSFITGNIISTIVMFIMIFISTTLRFWQESKANTESQALKKMVTNKITVIRQIYNDNNQLVSKKMDVLIEDVVPGDIVHLSAGDVIPGDIRIISSKDLFISQSTLTGETFPIEKHEGLKKQNIKFQEDWKQDLFIRKDNDILSDFMVFDYPNICFMGSTVVSGTAIAVVFNTGKNTLFGTIASQLSVSKLPSFFDREINKVSLLLIYFIIVMVPMVFVLNGMIKGSWMEALLFSISVAVGLTPEMLPMIVNSNLAKGAIVMAKKKTVVKKLGVIQNFGAMNILCTDKTGTLTQDKVVLLKYLNMNGISVDDILQKAFLNSFFQTGLKNLLDKAIISNIREDNVDLYKNYKLIDEIPFDFVRKRMSVILENINDNSRIFLCKGSNYEIIRNCSHVDMGDNNIIPITDDVREKIFDTRDQLFKEGLRVVSIAYKKLDDWSVNNFFIEDERELVFSGYVAFLDPPKDTAKEVISSLIDSGINVKILTGDSDIVTEMVCKKVGLSFNHIIIGPEVDSMTDVELSQRVEDTTIFARLSPLNKSRIVKILREKGNVVGFLGDGINDALALREADIGISVDTGTDLAKESADVILLEKDLSVLNDSVMEGRRVFNNINKYIKITCSSNFGNALSIFIASIVLPFLPMLPIQLLIQNLLYDISQTVMPWDKVDNHLLKHPKNEPSHISRFMLYIGPISSIFDIAIFVIMWFVLGFNQIQYQSFFHTGWFIEGLLTQILVVHMIRTTKIPFVNGFASIPVIIMSSIIVTLGLLIPFCPLADKLGFVSLPIQYFPWLLLIIIAYYVIAQFGKILYIKKFKSWI